MARLIDISVSVSSALPTWPGDPPLFLERVNRLEDGAAANVSRLNAGVHTGTHIDAPLHFIPNEIGVDQLDLTRFIGPCQVIELHGAGRISAMELAEAGVETRTERLLIKTINSAWWQEEPLRFHPEFRALDSSAARWVVQHNLRLVGIDYLSIESFEQEEHYPTHHILLGARIAVIEGLNLSAAEPGHYRLLCLPIKLKDTDGAPARAVLETLD